MPNGTISDTSGPTRGDGNLYITFVQMGQGDCIIISLPNGSTMMIDCGTQRWYTRKALGEEQSESEKNAQILVLRSEVISVILDQRFLHNHYKLDALILTHPDRDHCIEVANVLHQYDPNNKKKLLYTTTINNLYFSNDNLGKYSHGRTAYWLYKEANIQTKNMRRVDINTAGKTFNQQPIPQRISSTDTNVRVKIAEKEFVKILDGTLVEGPKGPNCEVFILAGNVQQCPGIVDKDKGPNRQSIVTMIQFGNKKFMFCGDATFHAEKFLIETYQEQIKDLYLLQVAHHGSLETSSSCTSFGQGDANVKEIGFVDHVNAENVMISAAWDSGQKFGLPRLETVDKFLNVRDKRIRLSNKLHSLAGYRALPTEYDDSRNVGAKRKAVSQKTKEASEPKQFEEATVGYNIFSTGSEGTFDFVIKPSDV